MLSTNRILLVGIISVGLLGLLTLVSAALVGLSVTRLLQTQKFERVTHMLPSAVKLCSTLRTETKSIYSNETTTAVAEATAVAQTTAAEADFVKNWNDQSLDDLSSAGYLISDFEDSYTTFRDTPTSAKAEKLTNYGTMTATLVDMVTEVGMSTYDDRFTAALNFFDVHYAAIYGIPAISNIAVFNKVGHFASTQFMVNIIKTEIVSHTKFQGGATDEEPSFTQLHDYLKEFVNAEAENLKQHAIPEQFDVVESTVSSVVSEIETLSTLLEEAADAAVNRPYYSATLVLHIIEFSVLAILSGISCAIAAIVLRRHWHYAEGWLSLLNEFHNAEGVAALREVYRPLVKEMIFTNSKRLVEGSSNNVNSTNNNNNNSGENNKKKNKNNSDPAMPPEIERPFIAAARTVAMLRPFVPQTLFGDYASADGALDADVKSSSLPSASSAKAGGNKSDGGEMSVTSNPAGDNMMPTTRRPQRWDVDGEAVRLETGSAVVKCTVMLVAAAPPDSVNPTNGVELQRFYNHSLSITTAAVNRYGGVIHQMSTDGRILAMWNATHSVSKPAYEALKAAEQIRKNIVQGSAFDINISTGSCLICNTKIAEGKHVLFYGYAFELVEKMLTLNRIHDAWLMLDSDTHDAIPRVCQVRCKPVGVLHGTTGDNVVVLSYASEEPMKGARWKAYNTAFTLYRHGFISDAITEYRSYLESYPHDNCAKWLLHTVLLPNQYDPVQELKNKERVKAGGGGSAPHTAGGGGGGLKQ